MSLYFVIYSLQTTVYLFFFIYNQLIKKYIEVILDMQLVLLDELHTVYCTLLYMYLIIIIQNRYTKSILIILCFQGSHPVLWCGVKDERPLTNNKQGSLFCFERGYT